MVVSRNMLQQGDLSIVRIEDINSSAVCSEPYFSLPVPSYIERCHCLVWNYEWSSWLFPYLLSRNIRHRCCTSTAISVVGNRPTFPHYCLRTGKETESAPVFSGFIWNIPFCQFRQRTISDFHTCTPRIMNGLSVLNSCMREISSLS